MKSRNITTILVVAVLVVTLLIVALILPERTNTTSTNTNDSTARQEVMPKAAIGRKPIRTVAKKTSSKVEAAAETLLAAERELEVAAATGLPPTTAALISETIPLPPPATVRTVPAAPPLSRPYVYWPRPFGLTKDNFKTPAGAMMASRYGQENDGDHIISKESAKSRRWVFSSEHTVYWNATWEAKLKKVAITPETSGAIRNMASAFLAYDVNPEASEAVPAYATICGNSDCPILPGHFRSLHAVGRFILILNSAKKRWVQLAMALEEAFPDRFIVEYSMVRTRQLVKEQAEYVRRHGDNGIMKGSEFTSVEDSHKRFRKQDQEDDRVDATSPIRTAYYRWHLRNLHPDLMKVPLSDFHSVSMGWNRILNLCFRGPTPIDYVFIANGDFYLLERDLPKFAAYTTDVIKNGPADRITLGGYQDHLSYAFFAYTYNAWQRFGEFDESMFPLYHEDNEFHSRILAGGMDMFMAFDRKFSEHHFKHEGSMSRRGTASLYDKVVGNMQHEGYLHEKYAPTKIGLTSVPSYKSPFNNGDIKLRHAWAVDTEYRKCLFVGHPGQCRMNSISIQRLLRGEDQTQPK